MHSFQRWPKFQSGPSGLARESGPGQSGPGQSGLGRSGPGRSGPGWSGPGQSGPGWSGPGQSRPQNPAPGVVFCVESESGVKTCENLQPRLKNQSGHCLDPLFLDL